MRSLAKFTQLVRGEQNFKSGLNGYLPFIPARPVQGNSQSMRTHWNPDPPLFGPVDYVNHEASLMLSFLICSVGMTVHGRCVRTKWENMSTASGS